MKVIDLWSIQVHGALGITDDTLLSFCTVMSVALGSMIGPDEVHKFLWREEYFESIPSPKKRA